MVLFGLVIFHSDGDVWFLILFDPGRVDTDLEKASERISLVWPYAVAIHCMWEISSSALHTRIVLSWK